MSRGSFKKKRFSNGLTLVFEHMEESQSVSIGAWLRAGSRNENPDETGALHFIEHMLFKGTETRSAEDISRQIEQVGGEFNAFTTLEHTCFHFYLLGRDFHLGMEILVDVLLNSTFDSEELQRERRVILQEMAMTEETPEDLVFDRFYEKTFGRHGLGRPIIGSRASLSRMTRADLIRIFKKFYRPDLMVISVAGNVSYSQVLKALAPLGRGTWMGRRKGKLIPQTLGYEPAPQPNTGVWWEKFPGGQSHFVWGIQAHPGGWKDRLATGLLTLHLGGGMSSLLFQQVREKSGLAYSIYASFTPFEDTGLLTVYGATHPSRLLKCANIVDRTIRELERNPMNTSTLKSLKTNLKGGVLLSTEGSESRMSWNATNEIYFGRQITPDWISKQIDEIQIWDVRRVARRILSGDKHALMIVGPRLERKTAARLGVAKRR